MRHKLLLLSSRQHEKKKKRDERERGTKGRGREVEFKEINLKVTHLMHKYRTGII